MAKTGTEMLLAQQRPLILPYRNGFAAVEVTRLSSPGSPKPLVMIKSIR
jgi:hypothetical protein